MLETEVSSSFWTCGLLYDSSSVLASVSLPLVCLPSASLAASLPHLRPELDVSTSLQTSHGQSHCSHFVDLDADGSTLPSCPTVVLDRTRIILLSFFRFIPPCLFQGNRPLFSVRIIVIVSTDKDDRTSFISDVRVYVFVCLLLLFHYSC